MKNQIKLVFASLAATAGLAVTSAHAVPFIIDDFSVNTANCNSFITGSTCTKTTVTPSVLGGTRTVDTTLTSDAGISSTGAASGVYYWGNTPPGALSEANLIYTPNNFDLTLGGLSTGFDIVYSADLNGAVLTISIEDTDTMTTSTWTYPITGTLPGTASVLTPLYVPFSEFNSNSGCLACTSADKITFNFNSNTVENLDVTVDIIQLHQPPQNNTPIPGTILLFGLGLLGLRGLRRQVK